MVHSRADGVSKSLCQNFFFSRELPLLAWGKIFKISCSNIISLICPDKSQFTWRKRNPIIQRRIDFWLISDDLQDDVKKAEIIPAIKTDHSAISLSVNSLKDQPLGPSYWKFNSSLLEDHNYIQLIHSDYPKWITEFSEVKDNRVLWDLIKTRGL